MTSSGRDREKKKKNDTKEVITFTKNPPANMKVMTVTEASVVAFLTSTRLAPIASPRP